MIVVHKDAILTSTLSSSSLETTEGKTHQMQTEMIYKVKQ